MAEIIVTATPVNLNVSTTQSNIAVTDLETNVTVNVASLSSSITVTNEPVTVTLAPSIGVSNSEIRAALTATSPITYDSQNGVFGFDASANNMQVGSLYSLSYIQSTSNTTVGDGLTVINNASIGGQLVVSGDITGEDLVLDAASITGGNYTQTGSQLTFAQGNIASGSLQLDNNITIGGNFNGNLKDISLSYYDAGNVSGNVTLDIANGPVQKIRLIGNLTGLSFTGATAAQPITVIIQQDSVGFWTLDTTTFASNWTNWLFTSNFKTLSTAAGAFDYLSVTFDGTRYYASLVNFFQSLITNSELANSSLTVNGTAISLGSSGNISHLGNLTTTALPEGSNLYFTAARARGNVSAAAPLTYNSATGQFGFATLAQIGGLTVNSTGAHPGVSLIVDKYLTANAAQFNGNVWMTERLTVNGNVGANYFLGNGAFLTGVTSLTNAQVISYISTQPLTVGGNLTVNGNINATGNINVQNVEDLYVRDRTIVLNANATSAANVQIVANRPSLANTELKWNEQSDRWTFTNDGTTYYNMPVSTTDLAEGTNLYYTTDRANTAIGAYQGSINTPGTITSGTANATTVNATTINTTDLTATNNVFALGALHSPDGSNIQYVRAWNVNYESTNTASSLNILLESENNSRIAYASGGNLRYVPATKTLFLTDGTIGSNDNNLQGNNLIVGNVNASGAVTATGNVQGQYIKGNGAFLTGITISNAVTQINTGENLTGGPITSTGTIGMSNTLANINSISSSAGVDLTLDTTNKLTVTQDILGSIDTTANITGDGYAPFTSSITWFTDSRIAYNGTGDFRTYFLFDGTTTVGSNAITGITTVTNWFEEPDSLGNVLTNSLISDFEFFSTHPFPQGTYVTSVDAANSTIYLSQAATSNVDLSVFPLVVARGVHDSTRGLTAFLISAADYQEGDAQTIYDTWCVPKGGAYGYPKTGFVPSNFTWFSLDDANSYSIGSDISSFFSARTQIEAPRTVINFPRGLTVGDADLTNRAENDGFSSFGLNVLWDGLSTSADYTNTLPFTQLLLKQYRDNSAASTDTRAGSGPRLFFTASRGNKNQNYTETYPLQNTELGRLTWWSPTSISAGPSTAAPSVYINAVTNRDMVNHNGGVGLYFNVSPHTDGGRRGQFLAHHLGNTLIASSGNTNTGASQPITFAPMVTALTGTNTQLNTSGNSIALYNNTMAANNYQWATINFENATAKTGSKLTVTNGVSTVSARNGNLVLSLDRNDNGAGFGSKEWAFKLQPSSTSLVLTEDDVIRTTFSGANITTSGNISADNTIVNGVSFNTAYNVAPSSGQIVYNAEYGAHQQGLNGSNVIIAGQDMVAYVRNDEANTLLKGEVVYLYGATGDKASVRRAVNSGDTTSSKTLGVVKSDIAAGELGYVVTQGVVNGLDLGAYTAGDILWLGNVAGTFTKNKPVSPEHLVFIGVVEKANAGNGQIYVSVQNGYELEELHDVLITNEAANDIIVRNSGNTLWVNQSFGTTVTNSNIKLKQFAETVVDLGNVTGDISSNINVANGTIYKMTATGNITINSLANAVAGTSATLIITQDSVGSKTLSSTMKFAGGTKTLSTAANSIDIISVFYDGSTYYATLSKGYA